MIQSEDLRNIYCSYVQSKYSRNKAKLLLISESYFEDFCTRYESSEKFRDEVLSHTRSYKFRKLMEISKKESF